MLLVATVLGLVLAAACAAPLDVYLLPHTHCDAGWLYTPNHYFYKGTARTYPVADMLTTVSEQLFANPTYRFVWAETIWLQMWWDTIATDAQKDVLRTVVARKQLEFVGGGWVMNDETMATYSDVIDQVTTGHEFIRSVLGEGAAVKHGWQIDMFSGYSGVTPSLWALAGYNATVVRWEGTQAMYNTWAPSQTFEYMWRASASLPTDASEIMTHIINGNYGTLVGDMNFRWEFDGAPPVTPANVAATAARFATWLKNYAPVYRGPVLAVWGNDFMFGQAGIEFGNMSQIVTYMQAHPELGINIQYSTLANYFDALYSFATTTNTKFPVGGPSNFTDGSNDFEYGWPHPIGGYNNTIQYQTGCLSSTPELKSLIRERGAGQRAAETTFALATALLGADASYDSNFNALLRGRRAMAIVQHHDAVSGTMATKWSMPGAFSPYDDVLTNYTNILNDAAVGISDVFGASLARLVAANGGAQGPLSVHGTVSAEGLTPVVVYNSLGFQRSQAVRVTLVGTVACVTDGDGKAVQAQLNTPSLDLWFVAHVPPLGYTTYYVSGAASCPSTVVVDAVAVNTTSGTPVELKTEHITAVFSSAGELVRVSQHHGARASVAVHEQTMAYFNGTGGAYILVENNAAQPLPAPGVVQVSRGPVVQEICRAFAADGVLHCSRIFSGVMSDVGSIVESEYDIGPLGMRTEIITRLSTDLRNTTLYNDDSGMEMHARPYHSELSIGGNYHAAVHAALLTPASGQTELAVLVSHSMGMASLADGTVEFMLHRRLNTSDSQGPWPLNDTNTAEGTLWLLASDPRTIALSRHQLSLALQYPLVVAFGIAGPHAHIGAAAKWSALLAPLPTNVHIQAFFVRANATLQSNQPEYVMRLHHLVERGDGPLAVPANVSLVTLFNGATVQDATAWTLTLQQSTSSLVRRQWPVNGAAPAPEPTVEQESNGMQFVVLNPLEFATLTFGLATSV